MDQNWCRHRNMGYMNIGYRAITKVIFNYTGLPGEISFRGATFFTHTVGTA